MSGSNKAPGVLARIGQAASYVFGGTNAGWFPPLAPLPPLAPTETAGRQFDYPTGVNINTLPRADEAIGFPELRALADNYDLLRLVIETRKDQLANLDWTIQPRDKSKLKRDDPRIAAIRDFLAYPDREHAWDQWVRMLAEDMLVIDAASLFVRRTRGGAPYALDPIDGATIKRVIDEWGRTPMAPEPAFQQVLKGVPAVNYTTDELLYLPRNVRTNRIYGYSPVEQVVITVNTGIRRQLHKLEFYTAGSVPDALAGVPATWTTQQIGEFQQYWDALLSDDTAARRRLRFVPGDLAKGFHQTKEAALKDDYDEWLARIVCYALSVSNQWAIKMMSRSTAETAGAQAQNEGLEPLKAWVKSAIDRALAQVWKAPDLELAWQEEQAVDPAQQAVVANTYVRVGAVTINEVRADLGKDPIEGGDEPLLFFGSGVVTLREALAGGGDGSGPGATPDPAADPAATARDVTHPAGIDAGPMEKFARATLDHEGTLTGVWSHFLAGAAPGIARGVARAAGRAGRMAKAAGDDPTPPAEDEPEPEEPEPAPSKPVIPDGGIEGAAEAAAALLPGGETPIATTAAPAEEGSGALVSPEMLAPATAQGEAAEAAIGDDLGAAIEDTVASAGWDAVETATAGVLRQAAVDAAGNGIAEVGKFVAGIGTQDMTRLAFPDAVAWAEAHAAELVRGVAATTADNLRALVAQAEREGWSVARLQTAIEGSTSFSAERAALIARTELVRASNQGSVIGWRATQARTGTEIRKRSKLGMNENHCVVCIAAMAEGAIGLEDSFVSGFVPPYHPNCYCLVLPVVGARMAKCAPDQPRDGNGRWAATGGGYDAAAEITRGAAAMKQVIDGHADVHEAMDAPGLGRVAFVWGQPGNAGKGFAGGYGISHVVAKHGQGSAMRVPETIARGKRTDRPDGAVEFQRGKDMAVLTQGGRGPSHHWVLTAYVLARR